MVRLGVELRLCKRSRINNTEQNLKIKAVSSILKISIIVLNADDVMTDKIINITYQLSSLTKQNTKKLWTNFIIINLEKITIFKILKSAKRKY